MLTVDMMNDVDIGEFTAVVNLKYKLKNLYVISTYPKSTKMATHI